MCAAHPSSPPPRGLRPRQCVSAHGLLRAPDGAVLLVRSSPDEDLPGTWWLPGGEVHHGEDPRETAVRGIAEETGLGLEVVDLRAVDADVLDLPRHGIQAHCVRLLFEVRPHTGTRWWEPGTAATRPDLAALLSPQAGAGRDRVALVRPEELVHLALMPFVSRALGLGTSSPPVVRTGSSPPRGEEPPATRLGRAAEPPGTVAAADEPAPVAAPQVQRAAAYALVVRRGQVLLTRLSHVEGMWTLPGGGIRFGEQPPDAVVREVHEETGLPVTVGDLVGVDSCHFTGHAPDGRLEDFHGIRVLYEGTVPVDGRPRVVEIGGTTDAVAWVGLDQLSGLPLTSLATSALRGISEVS